MLETLKALVPELADNDAVLEYQLKRAGDMIMDYCSLDEIPKPLESVQIEMAVALCTRMGDEGKQSTGEGGKSDVYADILSPDILRQLHAHRRLRW